MNGAVHIYVNVTLMLTVLGLCYACMYTILLYLLFSSQHDPTSAAHAAEALLCGEQCILATYVG